MTSVRALRSWIGAALWALALLLASPIIGGVVGAESAAAVKPEAPFHGPAGAPSQVSLEVAVGYQNIYRGTSWTPIRVTLRNATSGDISGLLQIPQSDQSSSVGAPASFHGLYQAPVTLPAGSTKRVTIYVPGPGLQGRVDVSLKGGRTVLATGSAYPTGIDSSALLIGVLAGAPGDVSWLAPAIQQQVTTHVIRLTAATLDPVAQALAAFDIIVLTNVDTGQLDRAQLTALHDYVRNGGSLLVIGGPAWQETLRPLPAGLLPGRLVGTRALPDLHGLLALGAISRFRGSRSTAVSVLSHPTGTVRASQAGVPLVVRRSEGQGTIEYLAFDPALSPIPVGAPVLERLITMAAPLAITRTWSPQGFRARFMNIFRSVALTRELQNVPAATLPLLAIFAGLTFLYVLILGPANFLVLRWIGRQNLAWITIPALALIYLLSMFGLATQLRGSTAVVNSIGLISLDGRPGVQPAISYLSLATPLPGDYQLASGVPALPAALPEVKPPDSFFPRNASTLHSTPLGMTLQEDPQTRVTFLSMRRWATRDVALTTSISVPGTVQSDLTVNARGDIAGRVRNGTNLDLLNPVIVAGHVVVHLADLPAGAVSPVRVHLRNDAVQLGASVTWSTLYGGPDFGDSDGFGGFGFHDCCDQSALPQETRMIDRERNAIGMLAQAQALATPGQVLLVGWSTRPLGALTVDGSAPQRRDLNLVVTPLAVHLPSHGPFRLDSGTVTAHLVDIVPRAPHSCCFGFGGRDAGNQISVAAGGSLTFEFDLPERGHARFQRLAVTTGTGVDSLGAARVYDWQASRWKNADLSSGRVRLANPNRFVSPQGQVLVELRATSASGDVMISDQFHAVDLSGIGTVT